MVVQLLDFMLFPFKVLSNPIVSFAAARLVVVFCLGVVLHFMPRGKVSL